MRAENVVSTTHAMADADIGYEPMTIYINVEGSPTYVVLPKYSAKHCLNFLSCHDSMIEAMAVALAIVIDGFCLTITMTMTGGNVNTLEFIE